MYVTFYNFLFYFVQVLICLDYSFRVITILNLLKTYVLNCREFEITEFNLPGFDCNFMYIWKFKRLVR